MCIRDSELVHLVDYEFLLRIILNEGAYFLPEPLYYFRVHSGSESNKNHYSENNIKIFKFEYLEPILLYNKYLSHKYFSELRKNISSMTLFIDAVKYYHYKELNEKCNNSVEIMNLMTAKFQKHPYLKLISKAANILTFISKLKK